MPSMAWRKLEENRREGRYCFYDMPIYLQADIYCVFSHTTMRKFWLLFSQTVTVLLAALFVVATLKPQWLDRKPFLNAVSVLEAPAGSAQRGTGTAGGFSSAAKIASAAVVSINTSKAAARNPQADDPWFKFFFGDQGRSEPQGGLGSGVIISASGYILTNNHVVEGADEIEVILNDSRKTKAKVIGTDPAGGHD